MRWPDPIYADSGNGGHLLYRIDLPAKDDNSVQLMLRAVAAEHGSEAVKTDLGVHNPAGISKLHGALACKGDSLLARTAWPP
jgi:hypothetical protein